MILTYQEVREHILDKVEKNYLIDGEEVSDTQISLAMDMVVSEWNSTPPTDMYNVQNFPFKHVMLYGVLAKVYMGLSALAARNQLSYSDGGISIPLEERMQLYQAMAGMYKAEYVDATQRIKISNNIDQGWGSLSSDYARFPIW